MSAHTGTPTMVRFLLRRDRIRIPVWIVAICGLVVASAISLDEIYPTRADLEARADFVQGNPATVAFTGPGYGLEDPTLGAMVANELVGFMAVIIALMAILLTIRHTRAEEESGRAELLRASALGRHAPTLAALLVVGGTSVVIGALCALGLILALDLPVAGALAMGLGFAATGLLFTGVAVLAAQVSRQARAAAGLAGGFLGLAYALRVAGDVGDGTLSWLSPIGWAQALRAFAGERWWPLLLFLGLAVLLLTAAAALASRRDVGAGLIAGRAGPARASRRLVHPGGLAFRLQRGTILAWAVGVAALGAVYGSVGQDVTDLIEENPGLEDFIARTAGVDLADAFFASIATFLGLIAAGCGVQSVLRMKGEEESGRLGPVLASALGRLRWAAAHLAVAVLGSGAVVAAGAVALGLTYSIAAGDLGQLARVGGAVLATFPAVLVLIGLSLALFGLHPRAATAAWVALGAFAVVWMLGDALDLPGWLRDLSPFEHVPAVPAVTLTAAPLLVMAALAATLAAAGLIGFRRRDVG